MPWGAKINMAAVPAKQSMVSKLTRFHCVKLHTWVQVFKDHAVCVKFIACMWQEKVVT